MKGIKRVSTILLAVILLITSFPIGALAKEVEPKSKETIEKDLVEQIKEKEEIKLSEEEKISPVANLQMKTLSEGGLNINEVNEIQEAATPESLGYVFDAETKTITEYTGTSKDIEIPGKFLVDGQIIEVEAIGMNVFQSKWIENLKLPNTIKKVGQMAFSGNRLASFKFLENLEEIGKLSFSMSANVKTLTVPGNIKVISEGAFASSINLEEVVLEEGVIELQKECFSGIAKLKKLEIPSTVKKIGIDACKRAKELVVNINNKEGEVEIEEGAFPEGTTINYLKETPEEPINVIEDPMLKKAINLKYKRDVDTPVTKEEVAGLERLYIARILTEEERWQIKSIEGMQYAENLTGFLGHNTQIVDLSPLENLPNLVELAVSGKFKGEKSPLKDISPISNMKGLTFIQIGDTNVEDISPLSELKHLEKLHLGRNEISDVSPLKNAPFRKINEVVLKGNRIADFSVIKDTSASENLGGGATDCQRVSIAPETVEFENPLKHIDGNYVILPQNEYIENTGDIGEKLKVLKSPEEGNLIEIKYGSSIDPSTLTLDISKIADKIEPEVPTEPQKVYFHILGKQGDTVIGRLYDAVVQVWNEKGEEVTNEGNFNHVWNLPKGKYTYKATHPNYTEVTGEFQVEAEELKINVRPQYREENAYKYPVIKSLEIIERSTKKVLGKGTFDGQIISVVIEDPKDRELAYNGKVMIKAETENALEYQIKTESSPSEAMFINTYGPVSFLSGENSSVNHPFKKDSFTFIALHGKGGLRNHYGLVIKENQKQHVVSFETSSDKDNSLGALKIPTGHFEGRQYWEVMRFIQLVNDGEKAVEPIKYIKDKYNKNARLHMVGGAFEGWYYGKDWVRKYDFETPVKEDFEIYGKFSNSSNITEYPDPFTVWFKGPGLGNSGVGNYGISDMEKMSSVYIEKDGEFVKANVPKDVVVKKLGDKLNFKFEIDENWDLAYLYVKHGGRILPVTQNSDGSFTFTPGPSQDSEMFERNEVYYNLIRKEDAKDNFDIDKQHYINLITGGPDLTLEYLKDDRYFTAGKEGNTIRLQVEGYNIDEFKVTGLSGKEVEARQVGEDEISEKGIKTRIYEFTMPAEDVNVNVKGNHVAQNRDRYFTFKVEDETGKEIPAEKVKKLVVSTSPYEYTITDITTPTEMVSNESGRSYYYLINIEDYGTFSGKFDLDRHSSEQVVLKVNTKNEEEKKKEDVERLLDVAKDILEEKDKYTTKTIENLEGAIEGAKQAIKLQSGYDYAFFTLTNAIDGLEKIADPNPDTPTKYIVSFDANGGTGSMEDKEVEEGKSFTLPSNGFIAPNDKRFKAWLVNGQEKNIGSTIVVNGNMTIKAIWEKSTISQPTNKDFLRALYNSLTDLREADYTQETWRNFKNAYDWAKRVLDDKNATQSLVDSARSELDRTYKSLAKKTINATMDSKTTTTTQAINNAQKKLETESKYTQMTDVVNHWAKDVIKYVMDRGYFQGTSATSFSPNRAATRAEFITVLGRIGKVDINKYKTNKMKDVATGVYYEGYVNWAVENGIIQGVGDNRFEPERAMTREEMAVILDKFLAYQGKNYSVSDPKNFADEGSISDWAKASIDKMTSNGLLRGRENNLYAPKATFTRAEVAQVIYNVENK